MSDVQAAPARTVLCFGDSNTHGTLPMPTRDDRRRLAPAERWPGVMAAALGPGWRVVEEGLPGRTTLHPDPIDGAHKNGLAFLPAALETHYPVDIVTLMLGTNDLKARFAAPAEDIADSVERLADAVLASGTGPGEAAPRVVIVAPPPALETGCLAAMFAGAAAKSAAFGRLYGELARRRGWAFLDAGAVIRSSPVDGIHFGAEEHAALGRAVAAIVAELRF